MFRPVQLRTLRWITILLNGVLLMAAHAETAISPAMVPSSEPLPPPGQVLSRLVIRAALDREHDEQFEKHYRYKRTKTTDTRDEKDGPARSVVVEMVNDPLKAAATTKDENAKDPQAKKRSLNRRDFKLDQALLDRFEFTMERREMIASRPTLVMSFAPAKKKLPNNDTKDRFINRTAGRVWVDEAEAAVVKLETRLLESVTFVGGIVGTVRQCSFTLERRRSPEGWWWTSGASWHLEGRKFFSPLHIDFEEKATEVEKVR
jgi:hypothetical protein